ncbi:hypothetical protein ACFQ2K_16920 [Streptomyces sanglieri]|uniref:Uncharacterized protein n=1 Tax=Streptomyces sanglieri TaxID=193460 RepID=A0ABW2WXA7_9ACTN
MKKFGRTAALAVSTAALASGVFATPATAAQVGIDQATSNTISVHTRGDGTPAPAQLGDPEEWGWWRSRSPTRRRAASRR